MGKKTSATPPGRSEEALAMAMEARCYNSGRKATKLKPLRFRFTDFLMLPLMVAYIYAIIYVDQLVKLLF